MERLTYIVIVAVSVPILTWVYYTISFGQPADKVFLTVSTFLFSIFTGFFISRQAGRFNRVRESVTAFDGHLSSIYRLSSHFGETLQQAVSAVLRQHYERFFTSRQWSIHFTEKSTTLQDIHALLDEQVKEDEVTKLNNQALGAMIKALAACQQIRKQQVAMYQERVPLEQWLLIIFFAAMLIGTVSTLPSIGFFLGSILKAAFVVSVVSVIYILYKLNTLAFSENLMGERSANDVLAIIDQKR